MSSIEKNGADVMALDDLGKLNAGYKLNIYFETNFDRRKSKKTEKTTKSHLFNNP